MKRISVTIFPKDEFADKVRSSQGYIVGYVRKGDYYSSELLSALGFPTSHPIKSDFDVYVVRRTDDESLLLIPRAYADKFICLNDLYDVGIFQTDVVAQTYFLDKPKKQKAGIIRRLLLWLLRKEHG